MAKYIKVLQEAMSQPVITNCKLSRVEIQMRIAEISEELRGPLSKRS